MKINKKKAGISLAILVGVLFLVPIIGFGILRWGILPPERLTPLVIEEANKFLEAHLECEKIELTYFETYPHLGIKLTNGRLISHQAEEDTAHIEALHIPSDSLLCFTEAIISLRPTDYLFGGKITIGEVRIESPRIYGYVNKQGRANWDIYRSETDSTDDNKDKEPLPPIDLQKVIIRNGHFTYDDRQQELFAEIQGFFLNIKGSMARDGESTLNVETGSKGFLFRSKAYVLSEQLALTFKSRLIISNHYESVRLQGAEMKINNLPFTADGSISSLPNSKRLQMDLNMGLLVNDLNDLLGFIPASYFQDRDKVLAAGSVVLEGGIHGCLGDSVMPTVDLCCKINNGSYHIKGMKQGIDTLQMDLDLHLDGLRPDSSFISLEELTLTGLNTSMKMHGKVTNLLQNPAVEAVMKGNIDFTRIGKEFLNPDTLLLQGNMEADMQTSFALNDLLGSRFDRMKSSGQLNIPVFKIYSRPLGIDTYISGGHLSISNSKKESAYLGKKKLLTAILTVDSMNIKYKEEIGMNVSRFEMQANTSPVLDTASVIPLTARIAFDQLRTHTPDSVWCTLGKTLLRGGIKPSAGNKRIPVAAATISVDTLKYFYAPLRSGMMLGGSTFTIEALPYSEVRKERMEARRKAQTEKHLKSRMAMPQQLQMDTAGNHSQLLSRWEVRGNVVFNQMRAFSRLFPIPMKMEQTNVKFNTNDISLSKARLIVGKSDLTLSGEILHIRQAMLRGGKLTGNFALTSEYMDCNELMKALNQGMTYEEQQAATSHSATTIDNMSNIDTLQMQAATASATTEEDQLFILPPYLDITLHTNAKQIDFKDLKLEEVKGEVILRDQSVNLSNLRMHSNMGRGDLTMVYTAKNKSGATAGFDLNMEEIQVDRLIGLFPSIDSLLPMLRSFQGVVDCQMTATCKIDSSMSLLLPSLHTACYLHGKNMVLLDGETFTEISKTLMFKNKKRNVIDSVSVDFSVHDNKIEVFPFLVEMDRYKVAVGGTQNLDMNFNYHISVLKSPVPFKLGIDITGNMDDFKYKIVKCRYKDMAKPARQAELDSTRINIRRDIRDAIRKQIREAAPELAGNLVSLQPHEQVVHNEEEDRL
ncbi:MAG: AsmA-like C-terminal region-containing protein [Tannerellaceae bacterium]